MTAFHDNGAKIAAAVITLSIFALIVFPLRVWVRINNKAWGIDDWCMVVGFPAFLALSAACLGGAAKGVGWHQSMLTEGQKSTGLMWFFFFEIFWCGSILPIKLSIAFMLARIAGPKRNYVYALWAASAMFGTMTVIAFFYIVFQCAPVSYAWDTTTPGGHCNNPAILADVYYATTAVNIVTDWFCAILPIPLLWGLQLDSKSKVSVGFLLGLGILASLSACIRLSYTVLLTTSNDYLYGVGQVVLWGYCEVAVGFVVGCCSTLRPLFSGLVSLSSHSTRHRQTDEGIVEMPNLNLAGPTKGKVTTLVRAGVGHGRDTSRGSWSESEENLMEESGKDYNAIYVSRSAIQETAHRGTAI